MTWGSRLRGVVRVDALLPLDAARDVRHHPYSRVAEDRKWRIVRVCAGERGEPDLRTAGQRQHPDCLALTSRSRVNYDYTKVEVSSLAVGVETAFSRVSA